MPDIKELPPRDRPRERLLTRGRDALSDGELVSLVLGGDLATAHRLLAAVGGAEALRRATVAELRSIRGIGPAQACRLIAALELGRRSLQPSLDERPSLSRPRDVAGYLADLADQEQEELVVVALDTRNRPLARSCVARGSLNVVHVAPREIFRRLVRDGAAAAIVAHNHPSGDPTPSAEDAALTDRLQRAGELLGVPLLDHLVVSRGGYHSFAEASGAPTR